jgi:hypothetical protein
MTSPKVWRLLEIYHAVVYFAPECSDEYSNLGLKGGWMGYFASRSAALGAVPPAVVTASFYNFKHDMVARALPDAWMYTTPQKAAQARLRVFDMASRRLLGDGVSSPSVVQSAEAAATAVRSCGYGSRPLFAAHAALDRPGDPHLALFWAATALREFRGDSHVLALAHARIDGCEAHVLMSALGLVPQDQRRYRGWSDEDWGAAQKRLVGRGWLDSSGRITPSGRHARAVVENRTDELSAMPLDGLGSAGVERLTALLTPIVARIITGGGIPYPNAMGMPAVPELTASKPD